MVARLGADATDAELVPVAPPPYSEELLGIRALGQHRPLCGRERLDAGCGIIQLQADGCSVRVPAGVERERNGVEAADPVAVEPADGTGLAVVEEHLQPLPGIASPPHHDAGVRRPVGVGFEPQLEVAVVAVGDQVPAVPRSLGLLPADDGSVLDAPSSRMGIGAGVDSRVGNRCSRRARQDHRGTAVRSGAESRSIR